VILCHFAKGIIKSESRLEEEQLYVTEPRAVATGPLLVERVSMRQQAGRILHPTRAARAGTPARSRFCNAGELRVLIAPLRQRGFADK